MAFLKSHNRLVKEGIGHIQNKNFKKALDSLKKAEKKKPNEPNTLNYLSQAYAGLGDLDNANEYIQKAISLDPDTPIHRQLFATYLMRQGKHNEAILIIDKTLALQPADVIYILRGQADYHLGNLESAIMYFDKALDIDNRNPLSNHMKGLVLYKLQRYEEAIPYLETALSFGEIESLRRILDDCKSHIETN
jgi:tetratricopeptide (TPR) repeat protein